MIVYDIIVETRMFDPLPYIVLTMILVSAIVVAIVARKRWHQKRVKPSFSRLPWMITNVVKERKPETVEQLIALVHQKYSIPEQEIMEHILRMQNQQKLILTGQQTLIPSTVKRYLFSTSATWYWTIIASSIITTAMVFTIPEEAFPIVYIRYILGSVFVLFLPGYSFIKALFPRKELDNVELVALSLGMSLALVPITGLLLNYTPWGIKATPITFSLLALTVTFATAAILREYQTRLKEMENPNPATID